MQWRCWAWVSSVVLFVAMAGCGDDGSSASGGSGDTTQADSTAADTAADDTASSGGLGELSCSAVALYALQTCVADYSTAVAGCYGDSDGPCSADDSVTTAALDVLQLTVEGGCADGDFGALDVDALVGRLSNACESEASSLSWRVYGGPHGAVWPTLDGAGQACLGAAHQVASDLVGDSIQVLSDCLETDDGVCDAAEVAAERDVLASAAVAAIEAECTDLSALIALPASTYIERAEQQVDCLTATGHPDPSSAGLRCGPTNTQFEAPRGEWTQVVVDSEQWGTQCGDGSDYAFYVRLAPEGEPLDQILIGLQGGGVCLFEDDCSARMATSPDLFNAMDDQPLSVGVASDDPGASPFANWTKVYLPYCNQDVFAGGGIVESLGSLDLPRYGGVNLRAAVQMVRDVTWRLMDEEGGAGFRPDDVVALFGGWSAGAYGALYNYHWFLDDLQWPRTIAFPDAGLALDNGSTLGVSGLGLLKIPAWGTQPNLPPYCFGGECAVGPVLYEAISPRLKQVPEQQMLILSNPVDATQQGDAFFDDEAVWINTMRQSYCDTRDLPGISYYFTSVSDQSIHVVSIRPDLWEGEVDGMVMRDWFWRAVTEPDTITSHVEEGDFVDAVAGVELYPCEVAP